MCSVDGLFSLVTEMATTDTMPSNFIYIFQPELASKRKSMANFEKESEMLFKWICASNACISVNVFVVCEFYVYYVVYVCLLRPYFHIYVCRMNAGECGCVWYFYVFILLFHLLAKIKKNRLLLLWVDFLMAHHAHKWTKTLKWL